MAYREPPEMTPEEEAEADIRAAEEETDNWLAEWSNDFWSDEWLAATLQQIEAA